MVGPHAVVVFLSTPEALADDAQRCGALATLTADEVARLERFRFARDRDVALASRSLQRLALASCLDVEPASLQFREGAQGKPELAGDLRFNVSNAHGLVVCAVTLGRDVGIDVEPRRTDAPDDIIDTHFAPRERAALRALPPGARPWRFVELWTLKEAWLKARGVGMTEPLDRFWFDLDGDTPRLGIDPALGEDAASWQVTRWAPTPDHCAALCVRRDPGPDLAIEERWL